MITLPSYYFRGFMFDFIATRLKQRGVPFEEKENTSSLYFDTWEEGELLKELENEYFKRNENL